jgi:hypothetical protein
MQTGAWASESDIIVGFRDDSFVELRECSVCAELLYVRRTSIKFPELKTVMSLCLIM